jgi:hypothetical protein
MWNCGYFPNCPLDGDQPVYWSATGQNIAIRPPEFEMINGQLSSINNNGIAVGQLGVQDGVFLWQEGTLTYLSDLLPENSGWNLYHAVKINDLGQIIGRGIFNGENHYYLATPIISVPSVVGLLDADAENAITAAGLVIGAWDSQYSSSIPINHIINQDPPAGTSVPVGSSIILTTSLGPPAPLGTYQDPVNPDGSSIFKIKRVIPIKILLTDCNGAPVSNATLMIHLSKVSSGILRTDNELSVEAAGNANSGNLFRYVGSGQYTYNLDTKSYSAGTYILTANNASGGSYSVQFSLKK